MHYLIKELVPPIVHSLRWYSTKYGWKGNYSSFDEAKKECFGYDEDHIIKKIAESTSKVRNGEVAYERDGILYDKIRINSNLLNALLLVSARNGNKLTLIDYGGSLGTSYYQNISFLSHLYELNWCIIEQPKFVDLGKRSFENEHIKFYNSLEDCLSAHPKPNLMLISSALQYLPEPYDLLRKVQDFGIPYIMLDLLGYNDKNEDRITIQHVPPVFYGVEASYPCRFFNKQKLENLMQRYYIKVFDFISEPENYYINLKPFNYKGSFWEISEISSGGYNTNENGLGTGLL